MKSLFCSVSMAALALAATSPVLSGCGGASGAPASAASPASASAIAEPVFEAQATSPLTKETELQVASVFAYEPGEQLIPPATEIAGFVADARVKSGFGKEALKTTLVDPAPASVKAKRVLVIAWGARSDFSLDRARAMGRTAMAEALKLGVADMAYAPIARDQGVTTIAAEEVAAAFIEGALAEYLTEQRASPSKAFALKHVTYEAGPAFIGAVSQAAARGVEAAHRRLGVGVGVGASP